MRRNIFASLLSSASLLLAVSCADPECEPGEFKVANICKKLRVADSSVGTDVADDAGRDLTGTIRNPGKDASKEELDYKLDGATDVVDNTAPDTSVGAAPKPAPAAADSAVPACVATVEVCDGHDNDCDGQSDEGVKVRCWPDADGDGFAASAATAAEQCEPCGAKHTAVEPSSVTNTDCADSDPKRAPSLGDVCGDKIDNDCDGVPDDDANNVCGGPCTAQLIGQPNEPCSNKLLGECARTGTYKCQTDGSITCSAEMITSTPETCDGKDNNCNGQVDEASAADAPLWYQDCDGDTYAPTTEGSLRSCNTPTGGCGWTRTRPDEANRNNWDCDDGRPEYRPGADYALRPDGATSFDMNCDGSSEGSPNPPTGTKLCSAAFINWYQRSMTCVGVDCDKYIAEDRCYAFLWGSPPIDERTTTYQLPGMYTCPDTAVTMFTSCFSSTGETRCQGVPQSGGTVIWPCR